MRFAVGAARHASLPMDRPRRCASCARRRAASSPPPRRRWRSARRLADRAQDSNAALTLAGAAARARGDDRRPAAARNVVRAARAAMRRLPHSEMYLKPALLAAATRSLGRSPNPADLDEAFLRRHHPLLGHGSVREPGRIPGRARQSCARATRLRQHPAVPGTDAGTGDCSACAGWVRWRAVSDTSRRRWGAWRRRTSISPRPLETARRMGARPWIARIVLEWVECLRGAAPQRALAAARGSAGHRAPSWA